MMFKGLLLLSIAAVALAQYGYGDAYGHNDYAQPIPYQYGYDIAGDHGEFKQTRQEHGDGHGNVQGSYGYTDAHGIYRQVDYVADAHGPPTRLRIWCPCSPTRIWTLLDCKEKLEIHSTDLTKE
ncbi:cuticle protein 10.9 [Nephila pilipes]|uniref:Cuticle protein 10.9 n=1 Tax=Nephila pilipes TaxID=299642 RepID=A0A8X6P1K5_NEPPI|nr:cuticle protein 10.9 [Nephila pilipes]